MQRNELEIPRVPAGHRFTETLALGFAASCIAQRGQQRCWPAGCSYPPRLALPHGPGGAQAGRCQQPSPELADLQVLGVTPSKPFGCGCKTHLLLRPTVQAQPGARGGPPVLYGSLKDPRSTYRPERSDQDPSVHIAAPAGSPMSDAPGRAVLPLLSEAEERLRLCAWSVRLWERRSDAAAKHVSSAVK